MDERIKRNIVAWVSRGAIISHDAVLALIAALKEGASSESILAELLSQRILEALPAEQRLYHAGQDGRAYAAAQGWNLADRSPPASRWKTIALATDFGVSVSLGAARTPGIIEWVWRSHPEGHMGNGDGEGMLRYSANPPSEAPADAGLSVANQGAAVDGTYAVRVVVHIDDGRLLYTQIDAAARRYGRALRQADRDVDQAPVGWIGLWMTPNPRRAGVIWDHWMTMARCPVWIGPPPTVGWSSQACWAWEPGWWHDEHGRLRVMNPYACDEQQIRALPSLPPHSNPWEQRRTRR